MLGAKGLTQMRAYRWRRVLRRTGQWVEADGAPAVSKAATVKKRRPAVRFARVAVSDTPPPSASMLLRLVLTNGRRAELEIGGVAATRRGDRRSRAGGVIRPIAAAVVYLCVAPTDLRKQAASLALLVEQGLKRDVFAPALYVFSNARRDRIRILYWERNGLVLWSKRLESERFIWPRMTEGDTVSMSGGELNQLLDGFDVWAQGHRELQLKRVG